MRVVGVDGLVGGSGRGIYVEKGGILRPESLMIGTNPTQLLLKT